MKDRKIGYGGMREKKKIKENGKMWERGKRWDVWGSWCERNKKKLRSDVLDNNF